MDAHKLKELLDGGGDNFLTIRQHRKVRKTLARKRVEVIVGFSGSEFLELLDAAGDQPLEEWLADRLRADFKARTGRALGFRYAYQDDDLDEVGLSPKIGSQPRRPTRIVRKDPPTPE